MSGTHAVHVSEVLPSAQIGLKRRSPFLKFDITKGTVFGAQLPVRSRPEMSRYSRMLADEGRITLCLGASLSTPNVVNSYFFSLIRFQLLTKLQQKQHIFHPPVT